MQERWRLSNLYTWLYRHSKIFSTNTWSLVVFRSLWLYLRHGGSLQRRNFLLLQWLTITWGSQYLEIRQLFFWKKGGLCHKLWKKPKKVRVTKKKNSALKKIVSCTLCAGDLEHCSRHSCFLLCCHVDLPRQPGVRQGHGLLQWKLPANVHRSVVHIDRGNWNWMS